MNEKHILISNCLNTFYMEPVSLKLYVLYLQFTVNYILGMTMYNISGVN